MSGYPTHELASLVELSDAGTWGESGVVGVDHPVLRSSNIQDSRLDLSEYAWRKLTAKHEETKSLAAGDIIVTMSSGSPALIGKCCLFRQPVDGRTYYFSNFTLRLRPKPETLDPRWLHYWLSSPRGRAVLAAMNRTTSGLRNLNKKLYLIQKVPLPLLAEQKRIAAILDKADAIRRKRQEAIALTEEFLRSAFLDMFGDPVTNPKGWEVKPLEQLVERTITYGVLKPGEYCATGPKLVRIQDVADGWVNSHGLHRISPELHSQYQRTVLNGGEIVISLVGTLGRIGLVPDDLAGANLHRNLGLIAPTNQIDSSYLWAFLRSQGGQHLLLGQQRGGVQSLLNLGQLRLIPVAVPPLPLQHAFSKLAERAQILKANGQRATTDKSNLFNALVQRAFRGEL